MKRAFVLCLCFAHLALAVVVDIRGAAAEEPPVGKPDTAADRYMELGTPEGVLGGEEQKAFERRDIKTQIKTFIPPLLRPAFTQHAFVLPPNAFEVSISDRFVSLDGDDFFINGDVDSRFRDKELERHFTDFNLLYGFDLDRKYLHGFTLRLNVPFKSSESSGALHPVAGMALPAPSNVASTQAIGDIGLFLKKKLWDQGTHPVGLAAAAGVFFPSGSNDEKFGDNGVINVSVPAALGGNVAQVFSRFTDDGRLPAGLQPGTGTFSYILAGFLTRQFSAGDFPGRSAFHLGASHRFVFEDDGVDLGDTTTVFASFVKPVFRDYLALDLTFVGFNKQDDSYDGLFVKPGTGMGPGNPAVLIPRPAFAGGFTGFIAPSLIFSPDPQIRMTFSGLVRVIEPDLGPAAPWVARAALEVIF